MVSLRFSSIVVVALACAAGSLAKPFGDQCKVAPNPTKAQIEAGRSITYDTLASKQEGFTQFQEAFAPYQGSLFTLTIKDVVSGTGKSYEAYRLYNVDVQNVNVGATPGKYLFVLLDSNNQVVKTFSTDGFSECISTTDLTKGQQVPPIAKVMLLKA